LFNVLAFYVVDFGGSVLLIVLVLCVVFLVAPCCLTF
jgi:hypothetical protein